MTTYANLFFSSFESKGKVFFEAFSDLCFAPGKYLTNGKTYVIEEAINLVNEERSDFDMKTWPWLKSAVAAFCLAITFFPGLIALGIARLIDPKMAERKEVVKQYLTQPSYNVRIPQPEEGKDLNAYMEEVDSRYEALSQKIKELNPKVEHEKARKDRASVSPQAVKVWESVELISLANQFMECMVQAAQVLKADLEKDGQGDLKEMGRWLQTQREAPINSNTIRENKVHNLRRDFQGKTGLSISLTSKWLASIYKLSFSSKISA